MNSAARLLTFVTLSIFAGTAFEGCRAMRSVASTSYHIATEPVRLIQKGAHKPKPGTRTTTTTVVTRTTKTTASDVTAPGRPISSPAPKQPPGRLIGTSSEAASPTPTPKATRKEMARRKSKGSQKAPSSSQKTASAQTEYPTAKRVPDKPGYVFSPFDPKGRYVDVSGYAPGSKVKDPWTDKIFVVP